MIFIKAIEVFKISKKFKVKIKEKGLYGSIKSILRPKYKEILAVDNVSFSVNQGEILAFIGPNGAGKSTTIKMLTSIIYPDNGKISVLGLDPTTNRKKLTKNIGTIFGQKEQLWAHLTPYDNFKFFGAIYDLPSNLVEKKINDFKNIFEIDKFINVPVKHLSLGQRMICEIIASLIHEPKILFLDEPTIGLDPVIKEEIRKLIKKLNETFKTTIFLTSHDIGDIEKLCNRVIIMNNGKIAIDVSMENLKKNYLYIKMLELSVSDTFVVPNLPGITDVKKDGRKLKIYIDSNLISISKVLNLLDYSQISDINISSLPLEEVISDIYRRRI
ncbi:MAG: ATP-binding cassette domain-containing protein [Clostridia bacterium]|nr:ATP-binding cassette domain-containing protein [Clostridia bacterium]